MFYPMFVVNMILSNAPSKRHVELEVFDVFSLSIFYVDFSKRHRIIDKIALSQHYYLHLFHTNLGNKHTFIVYKYNNQVTKHVSLNRVIFVK